jgi:endonuclease YncB( thermonuclease family)
MRNAGGLVMLGAMIVGFQIWENGLPGPLERAAEAWSFSAADDGPKIIKVHAAATRAMPVCGGGRRVNCVVDGDTLWLDGEKIRIEGMNAPEVQGACARERELARQATQRLSQMLSSRSISIVRNGRDVYGRTLATVRANGRDVAPAMVAEGLAHVWRGYKEDWCA